MTKTERESERKRRKLVDSLVKSLQNGTAPEEKVEQTGPSEKERVPASRGKVSSWQERQSRLCQ